MNEQAFYTLKFRNVCAGDAAVSCPLFTQWLPSNGQTLLIARRSQLFIIDP